MLSHHNHSFTNNASGNLNRKQQQHKSKQIDLDDLDVEMISPNFLQAKTLKKPLKEYDITLIKTNPQGLTSYRPQTPSSLTKEYPSAPSAVIFQKASPTPEKKKNTTISVIDTTELNISPAYKPTVDNQKLSSAHNSIESFIEKDKNTIFAAIMKKGLKPQVTTTKVVQVKEQKKVVGPAQAKLKALMNKKQMIPTIEISGVKGSSKRKETKIKSQSDEIGEEINEEVDQYGNQSFQKLSVGYQSVIRQSFAAESNVIKESIRESIKQSIRQSMSSSGNIKESIREDIKQSLAGSSRSLKEQIIEEISGSKGKSKESIEEVYQEIFEDQQVSNSLSRSQSRFKKGQNIKEDSLSQSASKSFRMKTNVVKSLKIAQELFKKEKDSISPKILEDPKLNEQITKQRNHLKRIQEKISKFISKQKQVTQIQNKNKDLYYHFKIQLNKLITGQHFESKLKKLLSFLSISSDIVPDRKYINDLQDNILKNVITQIQSIKVGKHHLNEVEKIKRQYQQQLKEKLLIQEVNLRAEMNQKLNQKDSQLKKMIAELESRMMARSFHKGPDKQDSQYRSQKFQVESDYSIDSENISWKADLWQLLPQFQKKKLYEKQSAQVTKFLADIMVNQIKEEALDRSIDISFEFPQEYNNILINNESQYKSYKENYEGTASFAKPTQAKKESEIKHGSDFLADLPKLNVKKANVEEQASGWFDKKQYSKVQHITRDDKIKPQIIKILSQYKSLYIKKKQQVIRNLLKVILSKQTQTQTYMLSSLQQLSILAQKEYKKQHKVYIKAYEEQIIMSLLGIYNKSLNKKQNAIEQEMKKMYDRLVVVCQVSIAEKCIERTALEAETSMNYNLQVLTKEAIKQMEHHPCSIEITTNQNYLDLKTKKEEKQIKDELVKDIVNILTTQFAKEFPKKKK